jgi:hypothetical protein
MSSWLDAYAKRAARTSAPVQHSVSRRRVLAGGSVVAAAWAAPMLTSSPAYAYGVSSCAADHICGPPDQAQFCCPGQIGTNPGQYTCSQDANNAWLCAQNGTLGGTCTNEGQGTSGCNAGAAQNIYCNGNSGQCTCSSSSAAIPFTDHICGGYGSQCEGNAQCAAGYTCVSAHFCAPVCSVANPCGGNGTLSCIGGVCRQTCDQKNDCTSRAAECVTISGGGSQKYCN